MSLPMILSGNILSPTVAIDSNVIENRVKSHAVRRLAAEKDRAVQKIRQKAETDGKKKLQETLKNNVPKELGNLFH